MTHNTYQGDDIPGWDEPKPGVTRDCWIGIIWALGIMASVIAGAVVAWLR